MELGLENKQKKKNSKLLFGKYSKKECAWAYFMIAPTLIGLLILNIIPVISVKLSESWSFWRWTVGRV